MCVCVCIYIYHIFIKGYVSHFQILATVGNAAVNIGAHISFQISVFVSSKNPEVELLDHMVILFLVL